MGKEFARLHLCLKSLKSGEGVEKAPALLSAAHSGRADSILHPLRFIHTMLPLHPWESRRDRCGRLACLHLEQGRACCRQRGERQQEPKNPSIPMAAFPAPCIPGARAPGGSRETPSPDADFPPSGPAGCQLGFAYKCCHIIFFLSFFLFCLRALASAVVLGFSLIGQVSYYQKKA